MPSNEELIKAIQNNIDSQENYEKLYNQNIRFIQSIISKRVHGIYENEDLLQSSFIALVKAVEIYEPEREQTNFLTVLKYSILNELRTEANRLPDYMIYRIINYKRAYQSLYDELGRRPKNYELMLELNIDFKQLEEIRKAYQFNYTVSLDAPVNEDNSETTLLELYSEEAEDDTTEFDYNLEQQEIRQAISEALTRLPDHDKDIIEKRYFKGYLLKDIGQELNVKPERVRQIEARALLKMRRDRKFIDKVIDYTSINEYRTVSVQGFHRTSRSSVEETVLQRERLRNEFLRQER